MQIKSLKGKKGEEQYINIEYLIKGGMGNIYTAIDNYAGTNKAVKIIPIRDFSQYDLLKREFDIATSLKHENIVDTEYYGEFEYKGNRYFYSVMEFYKNGSLRKLLKSSKQKLPINTALSYMLNIARGLEYAHKTIIHRDLKPENILLKENGALTICDFGIAKFIKEETQIYTFKGAGTPYYKPPESWVFDKNTITMDIYSLGIIFFELLTRKLPFTGRNLQELQEKHLFQPIPNILKLRAEVPVKLAELIAKMTEKRDINRYSNMSEVIKILEYIEPRIDKQKDERTKNLLIKANSKITGIEKAELERRKKAQERETQIKFLNYTTNTLFDKMIARFEEINDNLERDKIQYRKGINQLNGKFIDKSFQINFFSASSMQRYIEDRYERIINFQKERHGIIWEKPKPSIFQRENVILLGKLYFDTGDETDWGFNLMLRKNGESDLYGEWWICWFEDTGFMRMKKDILNNHYGIGIPEFYNHYELNSSQYTKMYKEKFSNRITEKLIEKLFE